MEPTFEVRNPYAAPSAHVAQPDTVVDKADRSVRLAAALVDSFLSCITFGPGYYALMSDATMGTVGLAVCSLLLAAGVAMFIYNLVLLHRHGQTIGKRLARIRIVRKDGSRASLGRLFGLRMVVPGLIGSIPIIGPFFGLLNVLAIFGREKRCLHDLIADTIVVNA